MYKYYVAPPTRDPPSRSHFQEGYYGRYGARQAPRPLATRDHHYEEFSRRQASRNPPRNQVPRGYHHEQEHDHGSIEDRYGIRRHPRPYNPRSGYHEEDYEFDDGYEHRRSSRPFQPRKGYQGEEESTLPKENIFRARCKVMDKVCSLIIDSGTCANLVSSIVVDKLGLKILKHPKPYKLQLLNESNEVRVLHQVMVPFSISKYHDEVLCDVVPMKACHILLGRPWQFDRDAIYYRVSNKYTITHQGKKFALMPLPPLEVLDDLQKLQKQMGGYFEQPKVEKEDKTVSITLGETTHSKCLPKDKCVFSSRPKDQSHGEVEDCKEISMDKSEIQGNVHVEATKFKVLHKIVESNPCEAENQHVTKLSTLASLNAKIPCESEITSQLNPNVQGETPIIFQGISKEPPKGMSSLNLFINKQGIVETHKRNHSLFMQKKSLVVVRIFICLISGLASFVKLLREQYLRENGNFVGDVDFVFGDHVWLRPTYVVRSKFANLPNTPLELVSLLQNQGGWVEKYILPHFSKTENGKVTSHMDCSLVVNKFDPCVGRFQHASIPWPCHSPTQNPNSNFLIYVVTYLSPHSLVLDPNNFQLIGEAQSVSDYACLFWILGLMLARKVLDGHFHGHYFVDKILN